MVISNQEVLRGPSKVTGKDTGLSLQGQGEGHTEITGALPWKYMCTSAPAACSTVLRQLAVQVMR